MLRRLPPLNHPDVLVGIDTRDDAGVFRLDARTALVMTTDFFTPIVDDAYDFGRIAAANALSDVYAMGARPLVALNLLAFPAKKLPMSIAGKIMEGGDAVASEAGVPIIGGHSIDDPEPKYGLAVVGIVSPNHVFRNAGARVGDNLILTKPLGTGIVSTAIKRGVATRKEIKEITELMVTLNRSAADVLIQHRRSVHAVTDVTGFGLLGHLSEMLSASGVGARLSASAVPILPAAEKHAAMNVIPGGTRANLTAAKKYTRFEGSLRKDPTRQLLLADAQTSGGLLAAVSKRAAKRIVEALEDAGVPVAVIIGEVVEGDPRILVSP